MRSWTGYKEMGRAQHQAEGIDTTSRSMIYHTDALSDSNPIAHTQDFEDQRNPPDEREREPLDMRQKSKGLRPMMRWCTKD